ncbi:MAG: tetratricopeptide repeat protein [Eubacterium sp.]
MICYNCGNVLTNSDYCSHCGMDVSVYKRIVKLSNTYYNAGLTKAKNRDLSGAADTLRRSVKLNKRNIDARNLLGLVYFEMGETVQAFSEWVMSTNIQPDNNPADRYLVAIQQEKGKVNELNHTIKKFNIALEYAKNGTDDMAIIQLKKVLNQNPNLIKGYQLLCLLYTKNGQYERAKRTIKKSMKIDKCNPLSIRYLREINNYLEDEKKNDPDKRMERRRSLRGVMVDRPYLSGNDVIIPQNNFKEAITGAQSILHIIIGLLLGAALVYFIVTPARMSNATEKINEIKVEYDQKIAIKNSTISELQNQIDTLEKENEKLKSDLAQYTDTDNTIASNYSNLLEAVQYYLNEDYDESAKALEKVDDNLKMDSKAFDNVYTKLSNKLSTKVAENAFNDGMDAYSAGNYDEAITQFSKCIKSNKNNAEAVYYLAYAYERKGDNENAQKYFKKIVDDFPDSDYAEQAKNKLPDDTDGDTGE